jgi:hypothetical protein
MLGNELPVTIAELLKQTGRALDVAEEERDGADRETCHRQHCLQAGKPLVVEGFLDFDWRSP